MVDEDVYEARQTCQQEHHTHTDNLQPPPLNLVTHLHRRRRLFLLCRRCDKPCTSGFVNDVKFSHNAPCSGASL